MPAISFSTMKDKILSGEKKQTIRPKSDYWLKWEKGDRLVGYWKMRSSGESEQLFDSKLSEDPFITELFILSVLDKDKGEYLDRLNWLKRLAQEDGFEDYIEMQLWFLERYGNKAWDMDFVVIRWENTV